MRAGLVSIIVPMFNAARFLRETLESVVGQTFSDWQMILVDDGSTDETSAICSGFLGDPRIKYRHQPNTGVAAARNAGFAASSGEFVSFLDADDVWLPNSLALKVDYLAANPAVGLVHCDMEVIDAASQASGVLLRGREGWILRSLLLWDGANVSALSGTVFRRALLLEQQGPFDPSFSTAADQDLFFRLAPHTRVGRVDRVLGRYRMHAEGMHLNIDRMEREHIAVYRKADQLGLFENEWFRRRCFSSLYLVLAGSWWHEGGRRGRALLFILRAVCVYPPALARLMLKALGRRPRP